MVSKIFSGANCPIVFSVRLTKPESLIQACTAPFLNAEHQETTERSYGDINLFCPLFPEINPYVLTQAFTSSHDTPRQRNLRHLNSALKEVERVILKRLHHLFSFSRMQPFPTPRQRECIYPDFPLIQLNMEAEVLSLPNMFLQEPTEKKKKKKPWDRLRQRWSLIVNHSTLLSLIGGTSTPSYVGRDMSGESSVKHKGGIKNNYRETTRGSNVDSFHYLGDALLPVLLEMLTSSSGEPEVGALTEAQRAGMQWRVNPPEVS